MTARHRLRALAVRRMFAASDAYVAATASWAMGVEGPGRAYLAQMRIISWAWVATVLA